MIRKIYLPWLGSGASVSLSKDKDGWYVTDTDQDSGEEIRTYIPFGVLKQRSSLGRAWSLYVGSFSFTLSVLNKRLPS